MKRATAFAVVVILLLVAGGVGYLLGNARSRPHEQTTASGAGEAPGELPVYTCSMHPQVRLDGPGNCPICEMPLSPAASTSTAAGEVPTLQLSEHALAMASIETTAVERRSLSRQLRAVGRIEYNESSLATITPRVDGFAERLFVSFTGVEIREGDHLAEVYSPELLVAQQEFLIALQSGADPALGEMVKTRLRLLGLTDPQITDLAEKQQTTDRVTLYSPISGTVIEKSIVEKAAFKAGDALYRIANLDSVWVYLDIYEYDLPWVRYGQTVEIAAEAIPGRRFEGLVTFVQPVVDDLSRTIRVPVYVDNADHTLKPGMFVTAVISAALTEEGQAAPTGVEGKYSCPMHPQVLAEDDGECPFCHMPLEEIPGEPAIAPEPGGDEHTAHAAVYACPMECEGEKTYAEPGSCPICNMRLEEVRVEPSAPAGSGVLAIPIAAVLDSGLRQIVYVERARGLFEPRELTLGPRAGEYFAVLAGLKVGERVVTRGNFLIDSQFQVTAHPSLFYPGGLHAPTGHDHGAAAAPEDSDTTPPEPPGDGTHQH